MPPSSRPRTLQRCSGWFPRPSVRIAEPCSKECRESRPPTARAKPTANHAPSNRRLPSMPKLRAQTRRSVVLPAIQPNAGVEAAYRKRLVQEVDLMARSVLYWTRAAWRKDDPTMAMLRVVDGAEDAAPIRALRAAMRKMGDHWRKRFDALAPELAKVFADGATKATDKAFTAALSKAGFAVQFKLTDAARESYQAVIQENIALIKSIPEQYLGKVEGDVWRAVAGGFDLEKLTQTLQANYGVTQRRAAFIAEDQASKAKATIEQARRIELGITEAIWQHSRAGQEPRQSHVAADGKKFNVLQGMKIDGDLILPGQLPRCRCSSRSIIPGLEDDDD